MSRLRGVAGDRVLLIPVDVGKRSAMSMVANQLGEVLVDPFEFALDRAGVEMLLDQVACAEAETDAVVVRFGIEAAGHFHRTLTETLRTEAVEVVELHPGAVHKARRGYPLRYSGGEPTALGGHPAARFPPGR